MILTQIFHQSRLIISIEDSLSELGRIAKGFDFLGYSFEPKGLSLAPKTLANFLDRIAQLYEQGADHI